MTKSRVRNVLVPKSAVMHNLNFGETFFPQDKASLLKPFNLPDGFQVLGVHYDYQRDCFCFLVQHETFDEVEECFEPPTMRALFVTVIPDVVAMLAKQRELCRLIEALPASEEATKLSVLASEVAHQLQNNLHPYHAAN